MNEPRYAFYVAVLVFRDDHRLLATRRAPERKTFPGDWEALSGGVGAGEQPLDAAQRVACAESGLAVELDPRPLAAYQAKRYVDDLIVMVFRGERLAGEVALPAGRDEHRWLTVEEFARACRFKELVRTARLAVRLGLPATGESDPDEIRV